MMNKPVLPQRLKQLYCISFIEGGVVMVTELAGARILTPFFGASLYSWAATLSITLLALMAGYYSGGYVTTKPRFSSSDKIIWVFLFSGLLVMLMPALGYFVMKKTLALSFFPGLIISELSFLFLPIFLMGMISPMIIFQITKKAEQSGRSAGNIYAISTCGGILFTLLFGFAIIPNYGISMPLKLLGLVVALMAILFLIKEKLNAKKIPLAVALVFVIAVMGFSQKPKEFSPNSKKHLVDYSEGLMGELKVVDETVKGANGGPLRVRKLRTNNIQQNFVFADMPRQSLMYYVNFSRQVIKALPPKKSALLVGLGAGSMYNVLQEQGMTVASVEIDQRIYDLGVKYFGLQAHKSAITDGRYFINVTPEKYDLVMLDCIIGENVPGQLITLESFQRSHNILNADGTLIIEYGGVHSFADNAFVPSIVKTLEAAGFHVSLFNPLKSEKFGDVVFVATKNNLDVTQLHISDDVSITGGPLSDYALPLSMFNAASARVMTDDKNDIDLVLKAHYFEVRKRVRKELSEL